MKIDIFELGIEEKIEFQAVQKMISNCFRIPVDKIGQLYQDYYTKEGINPKRDLGVRVRTSYMKFKTQVDVHSVQWFNELDIIRLAQYFASKYKCKVLFGDYFFGGELLAINELGFICRANQFSSHHGKIEILLESDILGLYQDFISDH